jgi:twitching motility protein PilT
MVDKEASDIEVGGFGSEEYVWMRVYGKKEPIQELPKFTHDEAALIILSILNDKQRQVLEEMRNLDFSFSLEYPGNIYKFSLIMISGSGGMHILIWTGWL